MLNLSVILEDSARRYAHKPAFTLQNSSFTYSQSNQYANKVAQALQKLGVQQGDKVAMCLPNILHFSVIYYGILKAGAVVVPLSVLFKKEEFIYHLTDSDAKVFISYCGTPDLPIGKYAYAAFKECEGCNNFFMVGKNDAMESIEGVPDFEQLIQQEDGNFESVQTGADDTAVIVYTSGTTGYAKGSELSHSNLFTNAVLSCDILKSSHADTHLIILPLFHIFGMTVMMNAGVYRGLHGILLPRFNAADAFRLIQQHSISLMAAVPTMYWSLLNYENGSTDITVMTGTLRLCISGGASLPLEIIKGFQEKFKIPILEGYGMSEGSPIVTFNQLDIGTKPGSIGTAVWGVEVKVVNENDEELPAGQKGNLVYRGPNVMNGYYKRPQDTAAVLKNGWLYSGDVAVKDEDGFFYIVDRMKDIIIRGGYNVYPREVEETIMQHPSVSLVSIIGIPDEKWGEEIKAFVVLKQNHTANEEEIITWAKERMASYKYPRLVEFIDALPLSASGKILKRMLRNDFAKS